MRIRRGSRCLAWPASDDAVSQPAAPVKVIISRHRDGEINAIAAERLGIGTIRGSGSHSGDFFRKGGPRAFRAMLEALEQGYNVASTGRAEGVARCEPRDRKLAAASGRPIFRRDRHQPLQGIEFVGSLRHQSSVWARRDRLGRPVTVPPMPTMLRWRRQDAR